MAQVLGCTSAAACRNSRAETRRSGLEGSPEVRYILEAVSKPRPAAPLFPLLSSYFVDSRRVSPDIGVRMRALPHLRTWRSSRSSIWFRVADAFIRTYVRTYAPPNGTRRGGMASWVEVIGSRCMHFRSVSGSSLSSPTGSSEDLGGFESTRETIYSALLADVAGNVLCAIMYLSSLSVFLFLVFFLTFYVQLGGCEKWDQAEIHRLL